MSGVDEAAEYVIDSGWLVEVVNHHTCGTSAGGYYGAHEPSCGMVPIAKVEDLLARLAAGVVHDERTGDLVTTATNGDVVRLHLSRFHGVIVTAARTYIGEGRREATAYFGDPQVMADWLGTEGYTATQPAGDEREAGK